MEIFILHQRKALSELISYVLLIVIAVSISIGVYAFLSVYTPKEVTECSDNIAIGINNASCVISSNPTLTLTLTNRGLFNIDAAYIRWGLPNKATRTWINRPTQDRDPKFYLSSSDNYPTLKPGFESKTITLNDLCNRLGYGSGNSCFSGPEVRKGILEIQPVIRSKETGKDAACKNAIITYQLSCA